MTECKRCLATSSHGASNVAKHAVIKVFRQSVISNAFSLMRQQYSNQPTIFGWISWYIFRFFFSLKNSVLVIHTKDMKYVALNVHMHFNTIFVITINQLISRWSNVGTKVNNNGEREKQKAFQLTKQVHRLLSKCFSSTKNYIDISACNMRIPRLNPQQNRPCIYPMIYCLLPVKLLSVLYRQGHKGDIINHICGYYYIKLQHAKHDQQ